MMFDKKVPLRTTDNRGNSAVQILVRSAPQNILNEFLKLILRYDKQTIEIPNRKGDCPFAFVIRKDMIQIIQLILSYSPSVTICKHLLSVTRNIEILVLLQEYIVRLSIFLPFPLLFFLSSTAFLFI